MAEKSYLWFLIENDAGYGNVMKELKHCKDLVTSENHDGIGLYELAVEKFTDVRLIKYMTENKLCRSKGERFSFSIASKAILNPNEKILMYLMSQGLHLEDDKENGCGPLHIACAQNPNPKVIKTLIDNGCDVNLREPESGLTPLLMAAGSNSNDEIIEVLHKAGADFSVTDKEGRNALHLAAQTNKSFLVADALVRYGIDVNSQDNNGCTPFLFAASNDSELVIKHIFDIGGKPFTHDVDGQTPIFYAAFQNTNEKVLKFILRFGCDINKKNIEGRTPLMYSALNMNDCISSILLDNGADPMARDAMGKEAYVYLLESINDVRVVKKLALLTDFDSNPETKRKFLFAAAGYNDINIFKYVTNKLHVDINLNTTDKRNVFHFAAAENTDIRLFEYLKKRGVDINSLDDGNGSPFLYACRGNFSPMAIVKLLELGADPNHRHSENRSALHIAAEQNTSVPVVEFLIESGLYDINEKDNLGMTPFLYSAINPNPEIMKLLVRKGADIKVADSEECNALCVAASTAKNTAIIDYLIELGFKADQKNKYGLDPIYFAALNNPSMEIFTCLESHGAKVDDFYPNGMNLLMLASRFNPNPKLIKYLVKEKGFEVNARTHESEEEKEDDMDFECKEIKALEDEAKVDEAIKKHKPIKKQVYTKGITPILLAAANVNIEVLEALIECGANIKDCDKAGRNILNHAAAYNDNPMIVRYLIQKLGFRTYYRDGNQATCAFDAASNSNLEVIKTVMEFGGDINATANGSITPLIIAAMVNNNPEMINFLVEQGLSVHDCDDSGMTPLLHAAAMNVNPAVAELLIAHGANIFDENSDGDNALALAKQNPNNNVYKTILKHATMNCALPSDTTVEIPEVLN